MSDQQIGDDVIMRSNTTAPVRCKAKFAYITFRDPLRQRYQICQLLDDHDEHKAWFENIGWYAWTDERGSE